MSKENFKHIVRIVGNDIPGERKTIVGLSQIRGIGYNFARSILETLKINTNSNIGNLTDPQVQSIEKIIKNPLSEKFPFWFLNRRKNLETGENLHLITSDIALSVRNDIEREKELGSWRGIRHMYGLKVRGQRTRTTGRKGGAVGVKKGGKILPPGAVPPGEAAAGEAAPAAEGAPAKATTTDAGKGAPAAAGKEKTPAASKTPPPTEKPTGGKSDKGAAKK